MKYIAIDTAGDPTVILAKNGEESYVSLISEQKRTSEVLLPLLDKSLDESGMSLQTLDFMAVVTGPGSFTGIRIGVNTVKTFSYVNGTPIVAIDSLKKLTYNNIPNGASEIISVAHAYANFCYIAVYGTDRSEHEAPQTLDYVSACEFIKSHKDAVTFADKSAKERLNCECYADDTAVSLAHAVEDFFANGRTTDYTKVEPFYLMKSQAERELESRSKHD